MPIKLELKERGIEKLKPKDVKQLLFLVGIGMGRRWRRSHLPRYFTPGARFEFAYARRKIKYLAVKKKKFGHRTDLVYEGELRNVSTRGIRSVKVSGTSKKVTARMPMPRKANLKNPLSQAHPIKELQSTSKRVLIDLDLFVEEDTNRRLDRRS